jgi:hypothetical protein
MAETGESYSTARRQILRSQEGAGNPRSFRRRRWIAASAGLVVAAALGVGFIAFIHTGNGGRPTYTGGPITADDILATRVPCETSSTYCFRTSVAKGLTKPEVPKPFLWRVEREKECALMNPADAARDPWCKPLGIARIVLAESSRRPAFMSPSAARKLARHWAVHGEPQSVEPITTPGADSDRRLEAQMKALDHGDLSPHDESRALARLTANAVPARIVAAENPGKTAAQAIGWHSDPDTLHNGDLPASALTKPSTDNGISPTPVPSPTIEHCADVLSSGGSGDQLCEVAIRQAAGQLEPGFYSDEGLAAVLRSDRTRMSDRAAVALARQAESRADGT